MLSIDCQIVWEVKKSYFVVNGKVIALKMETIVPLKVGLGGVFVVKNEDVVKVVFTHEGFYVVEKPAGVNFHDSEGQAGFFTHIKGQFSGEKLYPVHRLDKDTSGLLLVARSLQAEHTLQSLLRNRTIEKGYIAISHKKPKKKQGTVSGDMVRSRRKSWKLLRSHEDPAITQFFSYGLGDGMRFFCVNLKTGKTHQIRVALKSLGSPIVGDAIYSGQASDLLYLHSYLLRFFYNGEDICIEKYPQRGKLWIENRKTIEPILERFNQLPWPQVKMKKNM